MGIELQPLCLQQLTGLLVVIAGVAYDPRAGVAQLEQRLDVEGR